MKEVTSVFDLKIGDRVEYGDTTALVIGNALDSEKSFGALLMVEDGKGSTVKLLTSPIDGVFKVISEGNIEYGGMTEGNIVVDFESIVTETRTDETIEQTKAKDLQAGDNINFSGKRVTVNSVDHRNGIVVSLNTYTNQYVVSTYTLYPNQIVAKYVTRKQPTGITANFRTKD